MSRTDDLQAEIEAYVNRFQSARAQRDVDALLSQMTEDVVLLGPAGAPIVGHEALRAHYSKRRAGVIVQNTASMADFTIKAIGDVVLASGIDSAIEMPTDGGPAAVFRGPAIYIFRREGGSLKLARAFNLMAPVRGLDPSAVLAYFVIVVEKYYSSDWPQINDDDDVSNLSDRLAKNILELPEVSSAHNESIDADRGHAGADGSYGYGWYEILKVAVPLIFSGGVYAGKKALDVLSDIVKSEVVKRLQEKHGRVETIKIYGPDGTVVRKLEKLVDSPQSPPTDTGV